MRFGVLGSLEITADDGRVIGLRGEKQRALLAVLLCERAGVLSADQLSAALWRCDRSPKAKRTVPVYVHRLRSVLGGERLLNQSGDGYRLVVEPDEVDADAFERLATEGKAALEAGEPEAAAERLRRALALWRSDAYAGMEDLDPVRAEADRLNELRTLTREDLVDADLALGRHRDVIPELAATLHTHPLRERPRVQLMLALYRSGRAADALQVYRETRDLFIEELGIEAPAELRELERAILQEDQRLDVPEPRPARTTGLPAVAARPAEVPSSSPTFTGRRSELARLLGSGSRRLALNGPGGVGKSCLAWRAAVALAPHHPDGQLYVNLRGATPGADPVAPLTALRRFLRSLGLSDKEIPSEQDEAAARFRTLTADRSLLVVLDDAVDGAQVRPLLPSGPDSTALITSRTVLADLDDADHVRVGGMDDLQAVELLARLIGPDRVAAEPDSASEVVRQCGRLPLAVKIAGARLTGRPDWTLSTFAARLHDERSRLDELEYGDLAVRASLAVGWQGLGDTATRLLGLIGTLDLDDLGLPAAAALDGRPTAHVRRDLDRLVEARLLEPGGGDRYTVHDLVRLHAREQAAVRLSTSELGEAVQRLVHFYLATMRNASRVYAPYSLWRMSAGLAGDRLDAKGLEFGDRQAIIEWIRAESGNLVRIAHHAARLPEGERVVLAFALAVHVPVQSQGYWQERREVYELALAMADGRSTDVEFVQRDLGLVYSHLGLLDPARAILSRAAEAFRERGDAYLEADTLVLLAYVDSERSDHRAEHLRRARALSHEIGEYRLEANILVAMAELIAQSGNYDDARDCLDQVLELYRANGSATGVSRALGNLGELCKRFGHLDEAATFLQQAVGACRDVGFSLREAARTWDLADVLHDLGQPEAARRHWNSAIDLGVRLAAISPESVRPLNGKTRPVRPMAFRADA